MTSTTLARPAGDAPWGAISAVTIGAWFAVILAIASQDGYVLGPGRPPVPLLLSVAVPAGVFLTAYAVRDLDFSATHLLATIHPVAHARSLDHLTPSTGWVSP